MTCLDRYWELGEEVGKLSDGVRVLVVTKNQGVEVMRVLLEGGVKMLGENRVQEAEEKFAELEGYEFEKHLIGHLQGNKVKRAVEVFDVIQSVDSLKLAERIGRLAEEAGKVVGICLQVNVAEDEAKFGLGVDEVLEVAKEVREIEGVKLVGVMTIGKLGASEVEAKEAFLKLKRIFDEFCEMGIFECESPLLSMGMSEDYKIAVECGANLIRVGSLLFE